MAVNAPLCGDGASSNNTDGREQLQQYVRKTKVSLCGAVSAYLYPVR